VLRSLSICRTSPCMTKTCLITEHFRSYPPTISAWEFIFSSTWLDCPHIMEIVSSPEIVQLARKILGAIPLCRALEGSGRSRQTPLMLPKNFIAIQKTGSICGF
jgi:hypothetical protein